MANRASEIRRVSFFSTDTDTLLLVEGEPEYEIAVVAFFASANAAVKVTFQGDTDGSILDGYVGASIPFVMPELTPGWFRVAEGDDLELAIGAGISELSGVLVYRMVPPGVEF